VSIPFVPLSITAGRDCVVRYLAEQGLDYGWAREIPGALMEGVRRFVAGEEPLIGSISGPLVWRKDLVWKEDGYGLWRLSSAGEWIGLALSGPASSGVAPGWDVWPGQGREQGPETGDEGKALAEAVIRRRYWVTQ
jgi:hypothetical protein